MFVDGQKDPVVTVETARKYGNKALLDWDKVESVELKPFSGPPGFSAVTMYHLDAIEGTGDTAKKHDLLVKSYNLTKDDQGSETARQFRICTETTGEYNGRVEYNFYAKVAPRLLKACVLVPKPVITFMDDRGDPEPEAFVKSGKQTGTTCMIAMTDVAKAGARIGTTALIDDPAQIKPALNCLAGIHGTLWGMRDELGVPCFDHPCYATAVIMCQGGGQNLLVSNLGDVDVPEAIKKFEAVHEFLKEPAAVAVSEGIKADWTNIRARILKMKTEGKAFVHGDFQNRNLYFTQEGEVGAFDWQSCGFGSAAVDVFYLLAHCQLAPETRYSQTKEFCQYYHSALPVPVAAEYPFEQLWEEVVTLNQHVFGLMLANMGHTTPEGRLKYFASMAGEAVAPMFNGYLGLVTSVVGGFLMQHQAATATA